MKKLTHLEMEKEIIDENTYDDNLKRATVA